jgi:hypothetical protein
MRASWALARTLPCFLAIAGCREFASQPARKPAPWRLGPSASFHVTGATDLGRVADRADVLARDGGESGVFDGRSVWLFGDTFFRQKSGAPAAISNSWEWTRDFDARDGIAFEHPSTEAGTPAPFLRETPEEAAFNAAHAGRPCRVAPCGVRWALWPGPFVADPERHRALVFYAKIFAEPGFFRIRPGGESIAVWDDFDAPVRRPVPAGSTEPSLLFLQDEPSYGSAALVEGEELYAYGCDQDGVTKPCRVARVPLASALDRAAWRYYSGARGWSADGRDAVPVLDGNDVMSVAYNRYLGAYLAVFAPPLENQVVLREAPRPEGPWSRPVAAFSTEKPAQLWVYDAHAHPEYEKDGGRIQYVTYSVAQEGWKGEMRLVEVVLAK